MADASKLTQGSERAGADSPPEEDLPMGVNTPVDYKQTFDMLRRNSRDFIRVEALLRTFRRDQVDNRVLYSSPEMNSRACGVPVGFYSPDIMEIPKMEAGPLAFMHGSEIFAEHLRVICMTWDLSGRSSYRICAVNYCGLRLPRPNVAEVDEQLFIFFEDFGEKNLSRRDFERLVYDHPLNRDLVAIHEIWPRFDMIDNEPYRYYTQKERDGRLARDDFFVPSFKGKGEITFASSRKRFVSQVKDILNDVPEQLKGLKRRHKKETGMMAQELFYTTRRMIDELEEVLQSAQCTFPATLFNVQEAHQAHSNGEERKEVSRWILAQERKLQDSSDSVEESQDVLPKDSSEKASDTEAPKMGDAHPPMDVETRQTKSSPFIDLTDKTTDPAEPEA